MDKLNEWEKACKEFLRGCTCTDPDNQEGCKECLEAFCNRLRNLAIKFDFKEVNHYCIK